MHETGFLIQVFPWVEEELSSLRESGLYRSRRTLNSPQQPQLIVDGKTCLSFCSNDYLGLANHPAVVAAFKQGLETYGAGAGSAHLVSGHMAPHDALEKELAAFLGYPRALLFSTGYMANLGVASALLGAGDAVFEDRLNHASLLDAGLLSRARFRRYTHNNSDRLAELLAADNSRRRLIMTDAVFSMDGDLAPLDKLADVAQKADALLMIDDAHGFGVLGEQGRGSAELFGLGVEQVPLLMGTLGKALGGFGAFVAGPESLIELLIQKARTYIYTTATPPAMAEALRAALKVVQQQPQRRQHLTQLIEQFRAGIADLGYELMPSSTPIQPILVGSPEAALQMSRQLNDQGFLVTAIRPPTVPKGSSRLRVTLSAAHSSQQVEALIAAFATIKPSC